MGQLLTGFFFLSLTAQAATSVNLDIDKSTVKFNAVGRPSLLNIKGEGTGVDGSVTQTGGDIIGDIKFKLEKLGTGIGTRDEHMKKKYLEVEKYPVADLSITSFHLPTEFLKSTKFEKKEVPFKGTLSLHGVKKEVAGTVDLSRTDKTFDGIAKVPIKMSDFNIVTPKFAGIEVKDDVQIEVDIKGNVLGK